MTTPERPAQALYQQGLEHFKRAEWSAAIESFEALQALDDGYPEVVELLAAARLKQSLTAGDQPTARAVPPRRLLPVLAGLVALLLIVLVSWSTGRTPQPATVASVPAATPTAPAATARPTMPPVTNVALPAGTLVVTAEANVALSYPATIEFIVDASGSMLARAPEGGQQRWQDVQQALVALVDSGAISEQAAVALRTYGRRRGGDCDDLETVQRRARFRPATLRRLIGEIEPAVGSLTPLGAALRAVGNDLQTETGSAVVIVLTDGLDSCGGDPVAEAAALVRATPQRSVHVIGFAIEQQAVRAELEQIATAGRGLYFDARSGGELAEVLRQSLELSYQLLDTSGAQIGGAGVDGRPIRLDPGSYTLRINTVPPVEQTLTVRSNEQVTVRLRQVGEVVISEIVRE